MTSKIPKTNEFSFSSGRHLDRAMRDFWAEFLFEPITQELLQRMANALREIVNTFHPPVGSYLNFNCIVSPGDRSEVIVESYDSTSFEILQKFFDYLKYGDDISPSEYDLEDVS